MKKIIYPTIVLSALFISSCSNTIKNVDKSYLDTYDYGIKKNINDINQLLKKVKELDSKKVVNIKNKKDAKNHSLKNVENKILSKKIKWISVKDLDVRSFVSQLSGLLGIKIKLENYDADDKITFTGKGTLKQILEATIIPLDYYYEVKDNYLVVRKYLQKTFNVYVPSGQLTASFDDTGTSSSKYKYKIGVDFMSNLQKTLSNMLDNKKSKVVVEPITGIVSVYGTKREIERIKNYIDELNKNITDVVKIKLQVVAIQLYDKYSTGIDLSSIFKDGFKIAYQNALTNAFSVGYEGTTGKYFLNALREYGRAKIIESQEFNAINNFPIVIDNTREVSYLSKTEISYIATNTGNTTSTTPTLSINQDKIDEGTNFILVPKKIDKDVITINVLYEKNKINKIEPKTFVIQGQETSIQLPDVSKEKFNIYSKLKKGEQLVLISSVKSLNDIRTSGIPFLVDVEGLKYLFGNNIRDNSKFQFIVRIIYEK